VRREEDIGPKVHVEQASRNPGSLPGNWLVAWNIENTGQGPIEIEGGRLPHSQFRAEERELSPRPIVSPGESARLEFEVACDAGPSMTVENAFLILRVNWSKEPWRILARMRVVLDEESTPRATTEMVTTQRIGFSVGRSEN
jgi:hypothetical protein